jgi:hypothetical protein
MYPPDKGRRQKVSKLRQKKDEYKISFIIPYQNHCEEHSPSKVMTLRHKFGNTFFSRVQSAKY